MHSLARLLIHSRAQVTHPSIHPSIHLLGQCKPSTRLSPLASDYRLQLWNIYTNTPPPSPKRANQPTRQKTMRPDRARRFACSSHHGRPNGRLARHRTQWKRPPLPILHSTPHEEEKQGCLCCLFQHADKRLSALPVQLSIGNVVQFAAGGGGGGGGCDEWEGGPAPARQVARHSPCTMKESH